MTLTMADSITAANLPPGYDAYAGYVDGAYQDYDAIAAKFPTAHLYSISAIGTPAHEIDCEPGDLDPAHAVGWLRDRLAAGVWRPGIYADVSTMAAQVLPKLAAAGIARSSVRLRSAHYGAGEHICGPDTCKLVPVPMDGTQWTDTAPGADGSTIDASLLLDDFFAEPQPTPAAIPAADEESQMQLKTTGELVPVRFPNWPLFAFLFADFYDQPAGAAVTVRVALHKSGGWDVSTVKLTADQPEVTLPLPPATYDAASFVREVDGPAVAVSWR